MTRDEAFEAAVTVCAAAIKCSALGEDVRALAADVLLAAIADKERIGARIRKRRSREKARDQSVTERDMSQAKGVTEGVTSHALNVTSHTSDPPGSPQAAEDHTAFSEDRAEEDQKKEGEQRAREGVTERDMSQAVDPRDDEHAVIKPGRARWSHYLTIFERVVHKGMPSVPQAVARHHLTNLFPMIDARAPANPDALFETTLVAYAAHKKQTGGTARIEYFCIDFAEWADKPKGPARAHTMSEPVELDEQTRKRRDLTAKLRDERALLACASEAAKPRLQENVERLQRELEQLTTRAA